MSNEDNTRDDVGKYIRNIIKEETAGIIDELRSSGLGSGTGSGFSSPKNDGNNPDLGDLGKTVNIIKGLGEALRSPIDKAIGEHVADRIVGQIIPNLSQSPSKTSFLDSGFMQQIGSKLPETIPVIIDVLATRLGPDRAGKLIDGVQQKFLGGGSSKGDRGSEGVGSSYPSPQNTDELILSFDPENPSHLHHYMAIRNFNDVDIARKTLVAERDKLINKLKSSGSINVGSGVGGSGTGTGDFGNVGGSTGNIGGDIGGSTGNIGGDIGSAGDESILGKQIEQQNEILKYLVDNMQEDKKVMSKIIEELNTLKSQKVQVQSEEIIHRPELSDERVHNENIEEIHEEDKPKPVIEKTKIRLKKHSMDKPKKEAEKLKEEVEEPKSYVEMVDDEAGDPVFK